MHLYVETLYIHFKYRMIKLTPEKLMRYNEQRAIITNVFFTLDEFH